MTSKLDGGPHEIAIVQGTIDDVPAVLGLLDAAVKWLASNGRTGQWGTTPFSEDPRRAERLREFVSTGLHLWLAVQVPAGGDTAVSVSGPTDGGKAGSRVIVGALALGDKMPYSPAVSEPEVYVRLLVTDRRHAGKGVGTRLLEHARHLTRKAGVSLLRVDCYAGDDGKLVQYYESQGFKRSERLDVEGHWPCQVLAQRLDGAEGEESG
ncbi:acyl-CoA N-acyltransferase [Aspergillus lucknowensis]|uniref:Acyl-CoA N-acyltransferase n=1 Tax=Aspergillus lucknowensis TaxID=176173 RepID=A0ABR4LYD1_9EURO